VLAKDGDTSRGGSRRYYRIIDPFALAERLTCSSFTTEA
jgi:hypothetical protein